MGTIPSTGNDAIDSFINLAYIVGGFGWTLLSGQHTIGDLFGMFL